MSEILESKLSRFSSEINKVQLQIDQINETTNIAIAELEAKKKELRSATDPNAKLIQKNIDDITLRHDKIIEKLVTKKLEVELRKASIEHLDNAIEELDKEISRIQADRDTNVINLERKKEELRDRLRSVENLDVLINALTLQINECTHDYNKDMEDLRKQKEALLARTDLTPSEMALALAELEQTIAEKEHCHKEFIQSLERQRGESIMRLRELNMDTQTATTMKNKLLDEMDELEALKLGATPSEIEELNRRIALLQQQMEEIDLLRELNDRGLRLTPSGHIVTASGRILTLEEAIAAGLLDGMDYSKLQARDKLKQRGLELTPSGRIRTLSGRILTMEEATHLGLLDGIDVNALKTSGSVTGSTASLSTEESAGSGMSSEDVHYLKTAVGKPLTLALAEICSKQPRDPIHYLGHWLFKYRYNQEVDVIKKKEIEELIAERDRIRQENWHREIEEAARTAVLDMIFKAHDDAMKRELEEIARMQEMLEAENEELAEEAKDTLGEYNGPPISSRGNIGKV